jgi:hypothetical protein
MSYALRRPGARIKATAAANPLQGMRAPSENRWRGVSVLGLALTFRPEPAGRSLDDITNGIRGTTLATQDEMAGQILVT